MLAKGHTQCNVFCFFFQSLFSPIWNTTLKPDGYLLYKHIETGPVTYESSSIGTHFDKFAY